MGCPLQARPARGARASVKVMAAGYEVKQKDERGFVSGAAAVRARGLHAAQGPQGRAARGVGVEGPLPDRP